MVERLGNVGPESSPKAVITAERLMSPHGEEIVLHLNGLGSRLAYYDVQGLGTIEVGRQYRPDGIEEVRIGCYECPELQGSRQRLERRIQLSNGYGSQMIARDRLLRVDTGEHKPKGNGHMRPEWRVNKSLAGPYGTDAIRKVWIQQV